MNEPFIGSIVIFAGNFAPQGWALCNGQLLPIQQNTALFSILGTTYGGDGKTTFALPDLRGRVPVHPGQGPGLSPYNEAQSGGAETVTLTVNQLPSHNHPVNCSNTAASHGGTTPVGNVPAVTKGADVYNTTGNAQMQPQMIGNAGGSQPVPMVQPYLGVNFIIALVGIFPSRS